VKVQSSELFTGSWHSKLFMWLMHVLDCEPCKWNCRSIAWCHMTVVHMTSCWHVIWKY